ncbi:MAG: FeoB-associated Cys-rich membrane protein [Fimbriimonadaceae bacterium]|nr:FeoB-associated Cys-rich membrane protein [Fimbriimonadaceae bacterium]
MTDAWLVGITIAAALGWLVWHRIRARKEPGGCDGCGSCSRKP